MQPVLVVDPQTLKGVLAAYNDALAITLQEQSLWFLINLIFQVVSVALGVVSTLFMALQSDKNQWWTKPIGIIATTLSAGIVTAYSTFHIRENITTVMSIEAKIVSNHSDLEEYIRTHKDETSNISVERKYSDILNELGIQRRTTWGLIGQVISGPK